MAWDVTVADKFAASYIDSTAILAGAAAERAAAMKTKHLHIRACEFMGSWSSVSFEFRDSSFEKNHHGNWRSK